MLRYSASTFTTKLCKELRDMIGLLCYDSMSREVDVCILQELKEKEYIIEEEVERRGAPENCVLVKRLLRSDTYFTNITIIY